MADSASKSFDPGRYLTKVGSADYLEVRWRLVWLREVHPDALIETKLLAHDANSAIVWANVVIPGGGSASGIGSETYDDFRDFHEKAETKAIGRALAGLGFGTQFCPDHDFGSEHGYVVDSPVGRSDGAGATFRPRDGSTTRNHVRGGPGGNGGTGQEATPRQLKFIQAIAREHGISDDALNAEVEQLYGRALDALDRRDASAFIERLQSRRTVTDVAS